MSAVDTQHVRTHDEGMEISKEKLESVRHVVVHGFCPDGLAAAILVHDVLHAKISFVQHGTPEYLALPAAPNMMFVDIVPPQERLQEFVKCDTVVLDHHEKVRHLVDKFKYGVYSSKSSGAEMAFEHVWCKDWPGSSNEQRRGRAQRFAELAGIRDTWRRDSPDWQLACEQAAALSFFPTQDWLNIEDPFDVSKDDLWASRQEIGAILFRQRLEATKRSVDQAWKTTTKGGLRLVVLGQNLSNAADLVGKDADIIVSCSYKVEGGSPVFCIGLRSHTGVDVGDLAVYHGGGGHRSSSGFAIKFSADTNAPATLAAVSNPFTLVQMLVEEWEYKR